MALEIAALNITKLTKKRRVTAAFASAVLPGMGQWIRREKRQAVIFLGLFLAGVSLFWPIYVITHYYGWILAMVCLLSVIVTSPCMALLRTNPADPSVQRHAGWLLLILPFAILSSFLWVGNLQRTAGLRIFNVPSSSMERTIFQGDSVAADFRYYKHRSLQRGDIVVIRHNGVSLIKRIIGIEGDIVSSNDGRLTVNGAPLDEPYTQHVGEPRPLDAMNTFSGIKVPPGKLFVLGDNRNLSLDSRLSEFGSVDVADVFGKVCFVLQSSHGQTGRSF